MSRRIDPAAVAVGVLVSLGLIVPVALVARLVSGGDDVSTSWDDAFTLFVFAATAIGGAAAGRRRPDTPMVHGAVTGACTYLAARIVSTIASGEVPHVIGLVFALLVFAAIGAIGGFVATGIRRRSSDGAPRS